MDLSFKRHTWDGIRRFLSFPRCRLFLWLWSRGTVRGGVVGAVVGGVVFLADKVAVFCSQFCASGSCCLWSAWAWGCVGVVLPLVLVAYLSVGSGCSKWYWGGPRHEHCRQQ